MYASAVTCAFKTNAKIKESLFCCSVKIVGYGIQQISSSEKGDVSHRSIQLNPEQEAEVGSQDFSSAVFGSYPTCVLEERDEYMKFQYISWAFTTPVKNKMLIDCYCTEFSR